MGKLMSKKAVGKSKGSRILMRYELPYEVTSCTLPCMLLATDSKSGLCKRSTFSRRERCFLLCAIGAAWNSRQWTLACGAMATDWRIFSRPPPSPHLFSRTQDLRQDNVDIRFSIPTHALPLYPSLLCHSISPFIPSTNNWRFLLTTGHPSATRA